MYVDASALCSILSLEPEAAEFLARIEGAERRVTSPLAVWETVVNLPRLVGVGLDEAEHELSRFLFLMSIEILPLAPETGALALDAFRRYGRGRHPAALNFGDCFAYACAKHHKVPLLYKGNDFSQTDIETA
jgi:ribonuclease VapC